MIQSPRPSPLSLPPPPRRLREEAKMIQTLRNADGLVFLEKSFPLMFDSLPADEVLVTAKKELNNLSQQVGGAGALAE